MAKRRGNGEGSIYQDSDGRWRGVVDWGFENSKRKRKKLSGRTRAEVAEKMKKVLRDKQQGLPLVSENANFGQFLVKWLEEEIKPKREYNTYRSYAQQVYPHILPWLGHISFNKFTADILNVYLTEKLAELQEKLSPKAESKRRGART